MTHTLTIGKIEGAPGKRVLVAACSCGSAFAIYEGPAALAFETDAPRRARIWHGDHRICSTPREVA